MHRITRALALLFALILSTAAVTAERHEERGVSIRIHDYVHLRHAGLVRAQEVVSQMYGAIGVRATWLESLRQNDRIPSGHDGYEGGPSELTIIILTPAMAHRLAVPDPVIGYAAAARGVGGRIAYVIYDRIRNVARDAAVDDMRLMGIVMAHEIGHLLLAHQFHSADGLMRGQWEPSEFRSVRPDDLQFSTSQVVEIRSALGGAVGP
jgi:hypothetical protein